MPFLFSHVCDLFEQVAELPDARRNQPKVVNQVVNAWFAKHRKEVDELVPQPVPSDTNPSSTATPPTTACSATALLSTLLPDRRTDRVYALQARGLQRILIRALGLGHSRIPELSRWMRPCEHATTGPVDLADCVEAILKRTPFPEPVVPVSVEEVDSVLHSVAARCRFSAPAVRGTTAAASATRSNFDTHPSSQQVLTNLYQRLDPCGAKWLTRLILKDLRPCVLDGTVVARAFHRGLPQALQVHANLEAAVLSLADANEVTAKPRLGVKVGRQQWAKGRSIQHCISMAGPQRMSCEHKMDGEYVQVHINLENGADDKSCLQLFSKSGKDSTWDRVNLHSAIRESLRLGQPGCPITKGCILEGEMLAYDERALKIMDFDAIRKHVNRSGSRLFCDPRADTQDHEHLMIVYYDVMLIDDESLLSKSHEDRFRRLQELITCRTGYAELVQREVIDFRSSKAAGQLRRAFARCITAHLEGLVLKPLKDPYFDLKGPSEKNRTETTHLQWPYLSSYIIKLKKGYIGGFGEVGDFAVVGARYDAAKAREYPSDLPGLRWTHFFIGSLDTPKPGDTRPRFVVTNVVTLTAAQMATFLKHCRPRVVPVEKKAGRGQKKTPKKSSTSDDCPFDLAPLEPGLDDSKGGPTDLFADPPVVDIRCFSFHRQGYGRFWSPRFPSVVKFHFDRTYRDTLSFADLQTMAVETEARTTVYDDDFFDGPGGDAPEDGDDDDHAHWVARLKKADRQGIAMDAETSQSQSQSPSQTTARSQSSSMQGRSQSASGSLSAGLSVPFTPLPPIEILEGDEGTQGKRQDKHSQLSIVTVNTYKDEKIYRPLPTKILKKTAQPTVTVIDLTGDSQETEPDRPPEKTDAEPLVMDLPSTPKRRLPSMQALLGTPATPLTPRTPELDLPSSQSPPRQDSSPIDFISSLTAPSTTNGDSQESQESQQSKDSNVSFDSVDSLYDHKHNWETAHPRPRSLPGDSPSRKRGRQWEDENLCPVSPPQLKRAKSGL